MDKNLSPANPGPVRPKIDDPGSLQMKCVCCRRLMAPVQLDAFRMCFPCATLPIEKD